MKNTVTHSKERSFACRSRPRCVTLSVDLSSVNYERYSGDAGKSVNSGDRRGGLCVRDVDWHTSTVSLCADTDCVGTRVLCGDLLVGGQYGLRLLIPLHLYMDWRTMILRRTFLTKNIMEWRTVLVHRILPTKNIIDCAGHLLRDVTF